MKQTGGQEKEDEKRPYLALFDAMERHMSVVHLADIIWHPVEGVDGRVAGQKRTAIAR